MDEAKREEEYYRRLRIRHTILIVATYIFIPCMVILPLTDLNYNLIQALALCIMAIYLAIGLITPRIFDTSGFWYSLSKKTEVEFMLFKWVFLLMPIYALCLMAIAYIFRPGRFTLNPSLIMAILVLGLGPIAYFIKKLQLGKERKKDGEMRAVTLKSDGNKAREVVESALNSMKLQYREEKIGSKWEGFRDSYLLDSGLRITIVPISTIRSSIRISNISDGTLEKQIEAEILRRISE